MKIETRTGRWMVVDDDSHVLEMMQTMLEYFHPAIDSFTSPQTALAAFAAGPGTYKLVVTDFEMPGMDGLELTRRLRQMASDIKISMATGSGYVTDSIAACGGLDALLNKPFYINTLRKALDKVGVEMSIHLPA